MPLCLPDDILVFICRFLRVDVLGKLRCTCIHIRDALNCDDALTNALFVTNGTWYELKDVGLTDRCIYSRRLNQPPSHIDTMQNVAFFGTVKVNGQLIATCAPKPCDFFIDLNELIETKDSVEATGKDFTVYVMEWCHMLDLEWTDETLEHVLTYKHPLDPVPRWSTTLSLTLYAIIKDADGTQIHHFIDDIAGPNTYLLQIGPDAEFIDHITVNTDTIELSFHEDDPAATVPFQKWLDEYADHDHDEKEQQKVQTAFAQSNGRGWMNTRTYILDAVLSKLRRSADGDTDCETNARLQTEMASLEYLLDETRSS